MKKLFYTLMVALAVCAVLQGCGSKNETTANSQPAEAVETSVTESKVTKDMAFEGVDNYCHGAYDWSVAKDNPDLMYVEMGEESETEYQVIFHSYTGALVNFYVDKTTGTTRMMEFVPALNVEEDAGIIDIHDYLNETN